MNELNDYLITFYGELKGVREDLISVSKINPRLMETGGVIISVIRTEINIQELGKFLQKNNRLYIIQRVGSDLLVAMGDELNNHLFNTDENYNIKKKVNLTDNTIIQVNKIDEETKEALIDELLSKVKNNTITDGEKDILRKLVDDEE